MKSNELQTLRDLLGSTRVLALALFIDGEPHVSLLPYVPSPDYTGRSSTLRRWPATPRASSAGRRSAP